MTEKQLIQLKDDIEDAKSEVSKLEGRHEHLMQQLAEEWGCSSVAEAKEKLQEIKEHITELDDKIEQGILELEETYEIG